MAAYYKGTLGLIGNTPLVEVVNMEKELGLRATVLVKLEYLNLAGSVKDRIAKAMLEDAEDKDESNSISSQRTLLLDYIRHIGKYRHWPGSDRGCEGLSGDPYHARDHEHRTEKYFKGVWRGACIDGRRERDERSH